MYGMELSAPEGHKCIFLLGQGEVLRSLFFPAWITSSSVGESTIVLLWSLGGFSLE